MNGLEYNYCALFISIIQGWPPEQCFFRLDNRKITGEDIENMVRMKEAMTYKQIADCYGTNAGAVQKRISRYLKKRVAG